ncbi:choice-of-anchor J domain-containing protein, partial [Arthrospira platensis SPKY1]|nr:choice-of-anchor J domain-containing protein [Arthrospira platensis SPKY1]
MNGFNTGELEDDWLILPGFNKDIYNNVVLSFETWKRFGFEDDDNYFKLLYSTDYEGMGNPTIANWTELTFNQPVDEQVWESSGNIDLNSLQGELVYIAFRYHYNAGAYRLWQVDNISITGDFNSGNLPVKLAITD